MCVYAYYLQSFPCSIVFFYQPPSGTLDQVRTYSSTHMKRIRSEVLHVHTTTENGFFMAVCPEMVRLVLHMSALEPTLL